MNWININKHGQPINEGWYLVFDGEDWEKALYKHNKWKAITYKIVESEFCSVKIRDDITDNVTYYSSITKP